MDVIGNVKDETVRPDDFEGSGSRVVILSHLSEIHSESNLKDIEVTLPQI